MEERRRGAGFEAIMWTLLVAAPGTLYIPHYSGTLPVVEPSYVYTLPAPAFALPL